MGQRFWVENLRVWVEGLVLGVEDFGFRIESRSKSGDVIVHGRRTPTPLEKIWQSPAVSQQLTQEGEVSPNALHRMVHWLIIFDSVYTPAAGCSQFPVRDWLWEKRTHPG